jgi:hypothetical protein
MPKKLTIDSLSAELTSVSNLLESAKKAGDIVGEMQLEHRLEKLTTQLQVLKEHTSRDNSASVAIFFGGRPVLGSKGIAADFAGKALEQFQNLVSKTFAKSEIGQLGTRGKVPFKAQSELMVTGLARGSFGFVLDEMSEQTELEMSELSHVIDKATRLLRDIAAQDEAVFENLVDELDARTLLALKDIFLTLDSNAATIRVVEGGLDVVLDSAAIHRGKIRTETTSIEEDTTEVLGVLEGLLPEHRKFEIRDDSGNLVYGTVTKEAVEQFEAASKSVIGKRCTASVIVKTVKPLNRPPREVARLIEFLSFEA